jgi:hypothetical protein
MWLFTSLTCGSAIVLRQAVPERREGAKKCYNSVAEGEEIGEKEVVVAELGAW